MVNRSLLITFGGISGILLSVLYEDLDKLVRQSKTVDSHLQISEKRIFDFRVAFDQIHVIDNPECSCSLNIFPE